MVHAPPMRSRAFQHEHSFTGAREIGGAREPVVSGADDQRIPGFRGEFADGRGKADEAEGLDGGRNHYPDE